MLGTQRLARKKESRARMQPFMGLLQPPVEPNCLTGAELDLRKVRVERVEKVIPFGRDDRAGDPQHSRPRRL